MTIDPIDEVKYRFRLAIEHLRRAERLFQIEDWSGVVQFSQLAIENFTKALIAIHEVPTWSHDPSRQLTRLINRFPEEFHSDLHKVAQYCREVAVEHARSMYGEPSLRLTPSEIYDRNFAQNILNKALEVYKLTLKILESLGIQLTS